MMKIPVMNLIRITFFSLILSVAFEKPVNAQGNLQIMPTRVVFDGTNKLENLNIINVGQDSARYSISIINFRMTENGRFERIEEPDSGQFFAGQNIRIFPRSVTLAPNEAQLVKVQVIRTSQLKPGEYRSHLYFRAIPKNQSVENKKDKNSEKELSVELAPVFGISIPIIIRAGEQTSDVIISDVSLNKDPNDAVQLALKFNRTGNTSVYGDLIINHISKAGRKTQVGLVRGIAVYTPNPCRYFHANLYNLHGVDLRSGKLSVTYRGQDTILAEKELDLATGDLQSQKEVEVREEFGF